MRTALIVLLLSLPAALTAQTPMLRLFAAPGATEVIESAVTIDSPASGATEWFAKSDQRWVTVEPRTGVTPTRVVVRVNPSGLGPGHQRAILRFVDDAGEDMLVVPVSLNIGSGEPAPDEPEPAAAAAKPPAATQGTATPARSTPAPPASNPLSITIDSLPPATRNMPYSQAIAIKGGKPPYGVRIVDGRLPLGLTLTNGALTGMTRYAGTYPLAVVVTDSSAPPQTASKTLVLRVIIIYQGTALSVSAPSLTLFATAGQQTQGARVGVASGTQALAWTVASDQSWLRVSPNQGMAPGLFQVDVDAKALDPGTYVGTLTVTMDGAPNSPMRIPVQVTVKQS